MRCHPFREVALSPSSAGRGCCGGCYLASLEGAQEGGHDLGVEAAAGQADDRLHRELRAVGLLGWW